MKLNIVGHTVNDERMMGKILSSLPDRCRHFLSAWKLTPKSDRTLTNLTARLLAEEERGHTSSAHDNVAFKTYSKRGHIAPNCMKKQLGCKICEKDNHTEQNCYFRDINKSTTSNRDKNQWVEIQRDLGSWVLDSGCTSHMINNIDSLTNVTGIESEIITSKKNEYICAEFKGDIENLISVHKITENGGVVRFTDNCVEILKGRTKMTGEKDNAVLYNINLNCSETTFLSESKQTSDLNLWHRRIGHLNVDSMKKLATLSSGLEKLKFCMINKLTDWCRERGIKIDYDPAAISQLNGQAERLNRMLMEKTRALLFDSRLEIELWGEALRTATYLLNTSPSATVDTTLANCSMEKYWICPI
ncbi:hypothetical protein PR048_001125 [Dryococelus australis]|uniref:Integrase catalytic domain-containing protein n=1 Tax=Dryococelus australis TaxID=614101 RepID=A0ABQ9IGJ2_9NEOP|nr:hypothetical protein PR048_001125 [Dryococelus australis]